jgi:hypothetical protein
MELNTTGVLEIVLLDIIVDIGEIEPFRLFDNEEVLLQVDLLDINEIF